MGRFNSRNIKLKTNAVMIGPEQLRAVRKLGMQQVQVVRTSVKCMTRLQNFPAVAQDDRWDSGRKAKWRESLCDRCPDEVQPRGS